MAAYGVTPIDLLALAIFLVFWIGFTLVADRSALSKRAVGQVMNGYRRQWMLQMTRRDNRIGDIQIARNQMNGAAFFASAAIFAAGGVFALLGSTDQAMNLVHSLPFAKTVTPLSWTVKLLGLVMILAHAFFKFAWAFRLYNYSSVLIGATPEELAAAEIEAERAAAINNLAAEHFTRGLRALFFALAYIGWFVHPTIWIASSTLVVLVLYRREFRSRSLKIMLR